MTEYERKFILKELPEDFEDYEYNFVKQWYLTPYDPVLRIRLYGDGRCYFDVKWGLGISRERIGFKCDFKDVEKYLHQSPSIQKKRYKKRFDGYLFIIDMFEDGLRMAEIEADDVEVLNNIEVPDWMGEEVTGRVEFTNNWMAHNF